MVSHSQEVHRLAAYQIFTRKKIGKGEFELDSELYLECSWFSFSSLLQKELDELQYYWNKQYIRKSHEYAITQKPDKLYCLREAFGFTKCDYTIPSETISNNLDQEWLLNERVLNP